MPELITRANQAILEAQWLRNKGRSLRFEASVLASELGETILRSRAPANEPSSRSDVPGAMGSTEERR